MNRTSSRTHRPRRGSSRRRRLPRWLRLSLLAGVAVVVVAGVACGVLLARDVSTAKQALNDATVQAKTLQQQLSDGDNASARTTLRGLQKTTGTAVDHTDGPLWSISAHLPVVGRSVEAVQVATTSVQDIAQRGIGPLLSTSRSLDSSLFKPTDGRFDLTAFAGLAKPVSTASTVLTENRRRLDAIDPDDLLSAVRGPIADLKAKVATAQRGASAADVALRLAPTMLGGDGKRTYLLLFQNNAEARTTGGIPGAVALVEADRGRLSLDDDVSRDDIPFFAKPVVKLTRGEKTTVGTTIGTDLRDVNLTPSFPRTAQLARAMAEKALDRPIDGVVSVDPVALSYALRGTGPVKVADSTTLTDKNAVDVLLNEVYARYPDPEVQDAFFETSAGAIFKQVLDGRGDPRKILSGLNQAAREHRVLIWSRTKAEQATLSPSTVGGSLQGDEGVPRVGMYINDATSSKMQYYLRTSSQLKATRCSADGRQTMSVSTTYRSTAPADASDLPEYIVGPGKHSPTGTQRLGVLVALPAGAEPSQLLIDGKRRIFGRGGLEGRPIIRTSILLEPGDSITVSVEFTSGKDQRARPVLDLTPGVVPLDNGRRVSSACS
ncbi:hypothetical protein ASD11_14070 [Aeromicrobium sp. Root495]|uniref:DUF4012 domain-containing protein n=1 Tax=Aeromicrobium sp. Root495 TaxID=1736550 RepID=UPI000701DB5A|nr:DUF4012 domain-containing protein [Aeromicrobium sp. Root495]KQY60559.1 hypothetical protein ASD11_14070 [Aeromicrobium sp. Root495]